MKQKTQLQASPRRIAGKKVRFLRRDGITPANVFGHGLTSVAVQVDTKQLKQVLSKAGTSQLVTLRITGESEPRNVLVRDVQVNPLSRELLHVDLYQVTLTERMTLDIPIVLVGESPAVKKLGGVMLQTLNSLHVECLPRDIPPAVEVELSRLVEFGDSIHVKEISLGEAVTVLDEPDEVIISVVAPAAEEVKVEEVPVEEAKPAEEAEVALATEKDGTKKGVAEDMAPS
jgi:large subunit ribosomal protein L25